MLERLNVYLVGAALVLIIGFLRTAVGDWQGAALALEVVIIILLIERRERRS